MNAHDLLTLARASFSGPDAWVTALVLRRYINGRPDSFRIDDSTAEMIELPRDFTHVLLVLETPLSKLLARMASDAGATAPTGECGPNPDFLPAAYTAAADAPVRNNTVR